jgi:hypothetical protein
VKDRAGRLQWAGLALSVVYAAILFAAIAHVGSDNLKTTDGFATFVKVALAASPVALVALVLSRLARGRLLTAMIAAACTLLLLVRMVRGEATTGGIEFAVGFLVVLLVVEIVVSRWEGKIDDDANGV